MRKKITPEEKLMKAVYGNYKATVPEAIKRGMDLNLYLIAVKKYNAIAETNSNAYAEICEMFIKSDRSNLRYVGQIARLLTPEQLDHIYLLGTKTTPKTIINKSENQRKR